VLLPRLGCVAVLGPAARHRLGAVRPRRGGGGGRRDPRGGAVRPGVDERGVRGTRPGAGPRRVRAAGGVAAASVARGHRRRRRWRGPRAVGLTATAHAIYPSIPWDTRTY